MGVEVQNRPATSDGITALNARAVLAAEGWEAPWDWDHQAGLVLLGIHAPEPKVSALVEIEGADDDGALDTPAAEPSP